MWEEMAVWVPPSRAARSVMRCSLFLEGEQDGQAGGLG